MYNMGIVEIEPIKIKLPQRILRAIGMAMNAEVMDKLEKLEKEMAEIKKETAEIKSEAAENVAKQAVVRILRFGDEIYNDVLHTKEHFNQILKDITEYEHYCDTHKDFENDRTVATTKLIKEVYEECLENKSFL